jgi:hypothetical protein
VYVGNGFEDRCLPANHRTVFNSIGCNTEFAEHVFPLFWNFECVPLHVFTRRTAFLLGCCALRDFRCADGVLHLFVQGVVITSFATDISQAGPNKLHDYDDDCYNICRTCSDLLLRFIPPALLKLLGYFWDIGSGCFWVVMLTRSSLRRRTLERTGNTWGDVKLAPLLDVCSGLVSCAMYVVFLACRLV